MTEQDGTSLDTVWQSFHDVVNMSGHELRTWLMTEASGTEAFTASPEMAIPGLSGRVLHVLGKRKVDVTRDDIDTMRTVTEQITRLLRRRPEGAENDEKWRHALMNLGHDPLKPSSPRGEAEPPS